MFEKLQRKWKVSPTQLFLVLCTFAIGGSLTGLAGKKLMNFLGMEKGVLWVVTYILLLTLIWPLMVLLVSVPFGQFRFFRNYLQRMGSRMGFPQAAPSRSDNIIENQTDKLHSSIMSTQPHQAPASSRPIQLAIFASGSGTNAQQLMEYFAGNPAIRVSLVVSNKPEAFVLTRAANLKVPSLVIEKERFFRGDAYVTELQQQGIDFLVLAGFLWKVPSALIAAYPNRIINIHPALLPKYGGKGMYGNHVHTAVIEAGEKESGITIHYVDEQYDHGGTIFQATCPVMAGDTAETLAARIHELEHAHYPRVVEEVVKAQVLR